jgi:hypothetical protein
MKLEFCFFFNSLGFFVILTRPKCEKEVKLKKKKKSLFQFRAGEEEKDIEKKLCALSMTKIRNKSTSVCCEL